ncbi:MAG: RNase P modulator RnpM [Chloroflexota bacterium]
MANKRRSAGPRPRRVPQRTCVACRLVEGKRGLVRVVRTPEGAVQVDPTGKKNGRGAYLHASRTCWDLAIKRKSLQYALKIEIADADRSALNRFKDALPDDSPDSEDDRETEASVTVANEDKVIDV